MRRLAGIPLRAATVALVAAFWLPRISDAQVRAGVHGVYQTGVFEGSWGVGGRAEAMLDFVARGLTVAATYDHLFPGCEDCSAFDAGLQLLVTPPSPLYLGLGASYSRYGAEAGGEPADSDWALNLIAGIRLPLLPVVLPFVELRQQLMSSTINQQTLSLGVVFAPARARNAPARPRPR